MTAQHGNSEKDIALLGGFCLFLSALDYLIPKPLPFMRIGLANLPLLLALDIFSVRSFCLLALVKVFGQALISGTLFSYAAALSLGGTAVSAAVMYLLRRGLGKKWISLAGVGTAGAFVSNGTQLFLARFFVLGEGAVYLAPPFLAAGIISGAVLGICADRFAENSRWMSLRKAGHVPGCCPQRIQTGNSPAEGSGGGGISPGNMAKLCGGTAAALGFLLVPSLLARGVMAGCFFLLAVLLKKNPRPFFMLAAAGGIIACNLFPPYGKVLASLGPFTIAQGSLLGGIRKALTMEGLIVLSTLIVTPKLRLPGTLGRLLGESLHILEKLQEQFRPGKKSGSSGKIRRGGFASLNRMFRRLDRFMCSLDQPGF